MTKNLIQEGRNTGEDILAGATFAMSLGALYLLGPETAHWLQTYGSHASLLGRMDAVSPLATAGLGISGSLKYMIDNL